MWFFQWILKDALKVTSNLSYHIMQNASFNLIASKKKKFLFMNDYQEMEVTWSHIMVDSKKQSHSSMKCQYWTLMTSLFPSVFLPGWYSFITISSVLFTLASLKVLIKYCSWLFFSQFNVSNLIDIYSDFIYNETTKKMEVFRWCKIWLNKESLLPVTAIWHPWSLQVTHLVRVKTH